MEPEGVVAVVIIKHQQVWDLGCAVRLQQQVHAAQPALLVAKLTGSGVQSSQVLGTCWESRFPRAYALPE
jgi:hypothetical protein